MSHSLLFYPNLSAAWMDFCKSGGGETLRRGKSLLFLLYSFTLLLPGAGD